MQGSTEGLSDGAVAGGAGELRELQAGDLQSWQGLETNPRHIVGGTKTRLSNIGCGRS